MTRIRRMTVTLPPRLKGVAEHEARRIADAAAAELTKGAPQKLTVEVEGHGQRGHALATAVGGKLAAMGLGGRR